MLIFFCGKVTLLNFVRYIFYKYRFSFGKHQIDVNSSWERKLHCIETAIKFAFYVGNVLLVIFVNSSWRETGPEKRYWLKGGIFFALVKVLEWSFVLQIFFFHCQESRNETLSLELNFLFILAPMKARHVHLCMVAVLYLSNTLLLSAVIDGPSFELGNNPGHLKCDSIFKFYVLCFRVA